MKVGKDKDEAIKESKMKRALNRVNSFIKTSLLGGVVVILPAAISLFVFKWIFVKVTDVIQGPTNWILVHVPIIKNREIVADALVVFTILLTCFFIGVVVKTQFGKLIYKTLDSYLLRIIPTYSMIKEIVLQFLGDKKSPFSSVALVQIFENDTLMTGFVTENHENGLHTVFVPTGPNPTSGNIYHLKSRYVHMLDIGVEDAMKSIIGCGAGSSTLMKSYMNKQSTTSEKPQ